MNPRRMETGLAVFTLAGVIVYAPAETWFSWTGDTWHRGMLEPFYLVDLIAMLLLAWGAAHSLRARPRPSPGLLCAAYGWAAANGWRATFGRLSTLQTGDELQYGLSEAWVVGIASAIALACFAILLTLTAINTPGRDPSRTP